MSKQAGDMQSDAGAMEGHADVKAQLLEALPRVRRFALALTSNQDEADDLVQAVCERALSRLHQFREGTRMHSWLFRITQTVWVERFRRASTRRTDGDLSIAETVMGEDGTVVTEARLTLTKVRQIVAGLPHDQKIVLGLVSIDGCSYRDAAEKLGVPIGTVMSRLARARQRIAAALADPADGQSTTLDTWS